MRRRLTGDTMGRAGFFRFCLLALLSSTIGGAAARHLTFEDRVAAQTAIERVYYSHQTGATLPFETAVPEAVIREKVRNYLRQSLALERFWATPVTAAMLRVEMQRMAAGSRMPERLRELHRVLGDDAFLIQETLVRATLVDRLTRSFFASGDRFRGVGRDRRAGHGMSVVHDIAAALSDTDLRGFEEWWNDVKTSLDPDLVTDVASSAALVPAPFDAMLPATWLGAQVGLSTACVDDDVWDNGTLDDLPSPRSGHTAVWTGSLVIIWGGLGAVGATNGGSRYDPATDTWSSVSFENAPSARSRHTAVWTGSEMIVWGGSAGFPNYMNTGAAYDPIVDTWRTLSTLDAPLPRASHLAAWTGDLMLVWGGEGSGSSGRNDGGRYDPASDTWSPIAALDAPAGRRGATAVWTDTEMIVWGGIAGGTPSTIFNDGGRYDPASDAWTSIAIPGPGSRFEHSAIWTGSEMIVWGGSPEFAEDLNTGGRYSPATDSWTLTSTLDAPEPRRRHTAVWTGDRMIVWGGVALPCCDFSEPWDTGGLYDPATDTWTPTSTLDAPFPRDSHSAVWADDRMIVWGGHLTVVTFGGTSTTPWNSGGRYDPLTDTWTPTSLGQGPPGSGQSAIWTGSEMIIWGGRLSLGPFGSILLSTGGRYDPALDNWTPTSSLNAPEARQNHSAVWTGGEMIVWGGARSSTSLGTGGRYDPLLDVWTPTSTIDAPSPRRSHTAVWTGNEMIVWGGFEGTTGVPGTGGRYDPATDSWAPTTATGAPLARENHTAVWTGSEMIVWGSNSASTSRSGGRYDPALDSWTAPTLTDAPSGRLSHTAVWTGEKMIVWGGSGQRSGGLYDPSADSWTATTLTGAPTGRSAHKAIWTGDQMIVWGGSGGGDTGGRYSPESDSWTPTSTLGAPAPRSGHVVVWTGAQMIVWGGTGGEGTGGRYNVDRDGDDDGFTPCEGDCDDSDPAVNPGALEACDGIDNDCDDAIDEGGDALCDDASSCTTDVCDGTAGCSNAPLEAGTLCPGGHPGDACRAPDTCDVAGACVTDAFRPAGTLCGDTADTSCDNPDACDGAGACLPNQEPDGTSCTRAHGHCGDELTSGGPGDPCQEEHGRGGCGVCVTGTCVSLEDDQGDDDQGGDDQGDDDGDGVADAAFDSLRLSLIDPQTVRLAWQVPQASAGLQIDGYRVWKRDQRGCPRQLVAVVTGTQVTLPVPQENTIYSVTAISGPAP